ncbi:protein TIFY 5A [Ricinus communis]|uniref:protein TIFY 5A n=1 Tax=Ricinus communis TaxID=3988 RepID=UPI00201A3324|nr:protein TIFY 5A [Ricinus communis]
MRRNCSLELRPVPFSDSGHNHREQQAIESPQERQQLTIFYNGRVCVCYVTEVQARAILSLASREMEDKMTTSLLGTPTGRSEFVSPLPSPLCSPSTGLSMKRSIQRFLQKRKHRAQATSPYNY